MNKEDKKKAFTEAQKEVKEKQITELKSFIKKTLEEKERQSRIREEANRKIKILDKDIGDLKEGRLDRIEERQKADPKAKEISVALVEKVREVHHHHYDERWYWPYRFTWQEPYIAPFTNTVGNTVLDVSPTVAQDSFGADFFTLNNSIAKDHSAGTYSLKINGDARIIGYVS